MLTKALIVVDVQNDFCEGGALPVAGGNAVAETILEYIESEPDYAHIVYTKDWHKPWPNTNGGHFSESPDFVDSWPVHCVMNTSGAEFHWAIEDAHSRHAEWNRIFRKGSGKPDYSGFQGVNDQFYFLDEVLKAYGVTGIDVVGIAGDHCVRATALDGVRLGYEVTILPDMVASVGGKDATNKVVIEVDNAQRL